MIELAKIAAFMGIVGSLAISTETFGDDLGMSHELRDYLDDRLQEIEQISDVRKEELRELAQYVTSCLDSNEPARLTFICTHNSRRSQMSQVWAKVAARYYGVDGVETFSGGTEVTACNARTVSALRRAGLKVDMPRRSLNPQYEIHYQESVEPLVCFSKVYDEPPNPSSDFCAIMTCSQADKNCPAVSGSLLRIAIPYDDPQIADDTAQESEEYDARCRQICREMLYVFSLVKI